MGGARDRVHRRGVCFFAVGLKSRLGLDDSLDVVGVHMVGGIVGALLTGVFASLAVNPAGADGSLLQVGRQAVAVAMTLAFSFGATMLILRIVDRVVGLRATEETEETGLDLAEHGEAGYALTERGVASGPPVGWIPEGLGPEGVPEPTPSETFVRAVAERVEKLQTGCRS